MLMAIDEEMMGLVSVGTGGRVTRGLQNTLDHISDRLRLSAEYRKGFGCPKLQSSHEETEGGEGCMKGWMKRGSKVKKLTVHCHVPAL